MKRFAPLQAIKILVALFIPFILALFALCVFILCIASLKVESEDERKQHNWKKKKKQTNENY